MTSLTVGRQSLEQNNAYKRDTALGFAIWHVAQHGQGLVSCFLRGPRALWRMLVMLSLLAVVVLIFGCTAEVHPDKFKSSRVAAYGIALDSQTINQTLGWLEEEQALRSSLAGSPDIQFAAYEESALFGPSGSQSDAQPAKGLRAVVRISSYRLPIAGDYRSDQQADLPSTGDIDSGAMASGIPSPSDLLHSPSGRQIRKTLATASQVDCEIIMWGEHNKMAVLEISLNRIASFRITAFPQATVSTDLARLTQSKHAIQQCYRALLNELSVR
ncbi:hypothetical protein [Dongia sp.]|uniref:hypothetical protein n=1 Tax=Dongia sp. TaxID=1977262 RepID=UPI0035B10E28